MEELELRMYFFVPYQLTGIQQGIQSGHAALELALKYGRYNPNHIIWDFIEKHKTFVVLNGGTTNHGISHSGKGSLNEIYDSIIVFNVTSDEEINVSKFCEPDLNDSLTAVCFVCDERVFEMEKYPMFRDYLSENYIDGYSKYSKEEFRKNRNNFLKLKELFPIIYNEWVDFVGGEKNVFLKNLIYGKKLA